MAIAALAMLFALTVAACGGDDGEAEGGGGANGASAEASGCPPETVERVEQAKAPIDVAVGDPFDMSQNEGKTVYIVNVSQTTGYALGLARGLQAAGREAGVDVVVFDGKGNPELFAQGIEQAVARKADAIFINSIDPSLVGPALEDAKAAGIPVLSQNSIPPEVPTDGSIAATVEVPVREFGRVLGALAAVTTDCEPETIVAYDPDFPGLEGAAIGVKEAIQQACSECEVEDLEVKVSTVATEAAPSLESALQRSPDINTVVPVFDSLALYLQPAISSSNSDAALISGNGNKENLQAVRDGTQLADYAYAPTDYQGYITMDMLGRLMAGQQVDPPAIQLQLFDTENIPETNDFAEMWPGLVGYKDAFREAWQQ